MSRISRYRVPMPVALDKAKKDTALALFLQDLKWAAISEQSGVPVGTLRKWAARGNWAALRDKTKEGLKQAGQQGLHLQVATDLAKQGQQLRERLSKELAGQVDVLERAPAKTVKELRQGRSHVVKTIAEAGSKVFGWDGDGGKDQAVNLTFLTAIRVEAPQPVVPCGEPLDQAIDITPQVSVTPSEPTPANKA